MFLSDFKMQNDDLKIVNTSVSLLTTCNKNISDAKVYQKFTKAEKDSADLVFLTKGQG